MSYKTIKNSILCFLFMISIGHADVIKLHGKTIISTPTLIQNATLDLSEGYFFLTNHATLTIQNCVIQGIISPDNPILMNVIQGKLILKKNKVMIKTDHIVPKPDSLPPYNMIFVSQGNATLENNDFSIDHYFTASLLSTGRIFTKGFIIRNNTIQNFHGGFYLTNTTNAFIADNYFTNTSMSNIFILNSSFTNIINNQILFGGNNNTGDGIDLIDSNYIVVKNNSIYADSCYSLILIRCQNILIDGNIIADGITYGIFIAPVVSLNNPYQKQLLKWARANKQSNILPNSNITIRNNYLLQNRYGLSAASVSGLTVINNTFVQRFMDAKERRFWTDNDTVLQQIQQLVWDNNWYKEGFSQESKGDNTQSYKFVLFPLRGGVVL